MLDLKVTQIYGLFFRFGLFHASASFLFSGSHVSQSSTDKDEADTQLQQAYTGIEQFGSHNYLVDSSQAGALATKIGI